MNPPVFMLLLFTLTFAALKSSMAAKMMVIPPNMFESHLFIFKTLAKALYEQGHEMVIVVSNGRKVEESPYYRVQQYPGLFTTQSADDFLQEKMRNIFAGKLTSLELMTILDRYTINCDIMVRNQDLERRLKEEQFDLLLVDPNEMCGFIYAQVLGVKHIMFSTGLWFPAELGAPLSLSYVPEFNSLMTDRMTLLERAWNALIYTVSRIGTKYVILPKYEAILKNYSKNAKSMMELIQDTSMFLLGTDLALEFPRPSLPNIAYVGGVLTKAANPLPEFGNGVYVPISPSASRRLNEMKRRYVKSKEYYYYYVSVASSEQLACCCYTVPEQRAGSKSLVCLFSDTHSCIEIQVFQSDPFSIQKDLATWMESAHNGVVVVSFGAGVKQLSNDLAEKLAAAFARLPQNVLWRYFGTKPKSLGNNTKLLEWIPQNDLLGHPNVKAFFSHGGLNGIFESIYHGVPVVGIPLFGDHYDVMTRVHAKGMGIFLSWKSMTEEDIYQAMVRVTTHSRYKTQALYLSKLHRDQPLHPVNRSIYWIEYVLRHNGANHLRPALYDIPFYQYYLLDVLALVMLGLALVCYCSLKLVRKLKRNILPCKAKSSHSQNGLKNGKIVSANKKRK